MSEVDYGARARLDYIEKQLQALFPDGYVPFEKADSTGMPRGNQGIPPDQRRRFG